MLSLPRGSCFVDDEARPLRCCWTWVACCLPMFHAAAGSCSRSLAVDLLTVEFGRGRVRKNLKGRAACSAILVRSRSGQVMLELQHVLRLPVRSGSCCCSSAVGTWTGRSCSGVCHMTGGLSRARSSAMPLVTCNLALSVPDKQLSNYGGHPSSAAEQAGEPSESWSTRMAVRLSEELTREAKGRGQLVT